MNRSTHNRWTLTDSQLVHALLDSPWERALRESGTHRIDARTFVTIERSVLSGWLCSDLVACSRGPKSVSALRGIACDAEVRVSESVQRVRAA
jgi:hypothetical protein